MEIIKLKTVPVGTEAFENFFFENCSGDRMNWDNYFLCIAAIISLRSTCLRRKYGSLIVKNNKIVSSGYNGAPCGMPHCTETGECYRETHNIPHGQQYEKCNAVHSECNAIISGNPSDMAGADIYLIGFDVAKKSFIKAVPCEICLPMLINAKIRKVITYDPDKNKVVSTFVDKRAEQTEKDILFRKLFYY